MVMILWRMKLLTRWWPRRQLPEKNWNEADNLDCFYTSHHKYAV